MAQHPDILNKVRKEVDDMFDNVGEAKFGLYGESDAETEKAMKLPYLTQCVNETMRITPPVVNTPNRLLPEARTLFGFKFPALVPFQFFLVGLSSGIASSLIVIAMLL